MVFIEAYNLEWQRLVGEMRSQATARQRECTTLDRKIANLVDAVADGRASPALLAKLAEYEGQRGRIGDVSDLSVAPPALHPGIGELYITNVWKLSSSLASGDDPETLEAARSLID